jgi:hypothetical protein
MGQDSIVGQSFILLNAKTHFFGLAARFNCITIVHLAKRQKAFSTDRLARSFVAQMYILLILQSQYFKPEKADVFGLDVSVGLWVDLCGLHPARKRSKGVWGLWKIAPN